MKPILLVEDNAEDVFLFTSACQRSNFPHKLQVVRDGLEAVAYLSGDGPFADREKHPIPHLVFLDISMPRMNGHDVLKWIRTQPEFGRLPVIILTTSNRPADLQQSYSLGATSFLRKADNLPDFATNMETILKYWLAHNISPEAFSGGWVAQ